MNGALDGDLRKAMLKVQYIFEELAVVAPVQFACELFLLVFRQHKDIALASMANVLHRAKHSLDAAILMHAALETSVELDIAYFALGNIYAVSSYSYCKNLHGVTTFKMH